MNNANNNINTLKIKNLAEEDRPREKLMNKGRQALTDAELIAILIGSGTRQLSAVEVGRQVLHIAGNNLHELSKKSMKELMKINGIGEAKAISIISALELGRRRKESDIVIKPKITSSKDVFELMKEHLMDITHEEFWILHLSRSNQVIKKEKISQGGLSGTVADPKIIFKKALEELASALILVHNHPSGNTSPSQADIRLTNKITEGGKLLDISVLDHIIFANHDYYSFAEEGIL